MRQATTQDEGQVELVAQAVLAVLAVLVLVLVLVLQPTAVVRMVP